MRKNNNLRRFQLKDGKEYCFDCDRFKSELNKIAKKAKETHQVSTIKEYEDKFIKCIGVSESALKQWKAGNNGVSDLDRVKEIANFLGMSNYKDLLIDVSESRDKEGGDNRMNLDNAIKGSVSDFVRMKIFECNSLILDFLHSELIEDEEEYCKLLQEINKYSIAIPDDVFKKIIGFVEEYLEPIIYDRENYFSETYTEEYGSFNEYGTFCVAEDKTMQFLGSYLRKIVDIEDWFQDFGKRELYPLLTGEKYS